MKPLFWIVAVVNLALGLFNLAFLYALTTIDKSHYDAIVALEGVNEEREKEEAQQLLDEPSLKSEIEGLSRLIGTLLPRVQKLEDRTAVLADPDATEIPLDLSEDFP